mmetsp:Transcript_37571/g.120759  ORF Transcript_37571/g.120759 Transcript_37571/m.120759 type:complete len:314 (-) Transcript_37571:370-1311(-)
MLPVVVVVAFLVTLTWAARPAVMVNGLPGAMGREVAAACLRRGLEVAPFALTGPGFGGDVISIDDGQGGPPTRVSLYDPNARDALAQVVRETYPVDGEAILICVDYTHPSAVNGNAEWYAANKFPFVMGTTGGDRESLLDAVTGVTSCVIAPNMAKQIVALQAAFEKLATDFPGAFSGYHLRVVESHQATKADTSGTAKAISADLARLTAETDWSDDSIERVRDVSEQMAGGGSSHAGVSPVPEDALNGHAYHTYSMVSADKKVEFQIRHNVQGRTTYAEGTVDAVVFLAERVAEGGAPKVFNMIDVLQAGAM